MGVLVIVIHKRRLNELEYGIAPLKNSTTNENEERDLFFTHMKNLKTKACLNQTLVQRHLNVNFRRLFKLISAYANSRSPD